MNVLKTQMNVMSRPRVKTLSEVISVCVTKDGLEMGHSVQVSVLAKVYVYTVK
jgi:hypothetical protein